MSDQTDELLTWGEVSGIAKISRSQIWKLEQTGRFPPHVKIGARAIRWRKSDVLSWLASLQQQPTRRAWHPLKAGAAAAPGDAA